MHEDVNNHWGTVYGFIATIFFMPSSGEIFSRIILATVTASTGAVVGFCVTKFVMNPLMKWLSQIKEPADKE